jgi:hypothetical protein
MVLHPLTEARTVGSPLARACRIRWSRSVMAANYVLDQRGAEIVAASRDEPPPRRDEMIARRRRIATSRTLDHQLGINQFFTDLAGHARTHPPARMVRWWSERQCARPGARGRARACEGPP